MEFTRHDGARISKLELACIEASRTALSDGLKPEMSQVEVDTWLALTGRVYEGSIVVVIDNDCNPYARTVSQGTSVGTKVL